MSMPSTLEVMCTLASRSLLARHETWNRFTSLTMSALSTDGQLTIRLCGWWLQGFQLVQMAMGTGCIGEAALLNPDAEHLLDILMPWQPVC